MPGAEASGLTNASGQPYSSATEEGHDVVAPQEPGSTSSPESVIPTANAS